MMTHFKNIYNLLSAFTVKEAMLDQLE